MHECIVGKLGASRDDYTAAKLVAIGDWSNGFLRACRNKTCVASLA